MTDPVSGDLVISKLKRIKPYTESQLFGFYTNPELESTENFLDNFIKDALNIEECKFYQSFVELNKLREFLAKTSRELENLKVSCNDDRNKAWLISKKTAKMKGRCVDGRSVEAVHSYNFAVYQEKSAKSLETNQAILHEKLTNDYCYQLFMVQMTKKEIEYEISRVTSENDLTLKVKKIKSLISALFAFHRRMEIEEDTINSSIKQWIGQLVASLLPLASREETLFLLNHILRCPGNVGTWASSFIQCPSPLHASTFTEAVNILNHCMNIICLVLSPIRARDKFLKQTPNQAQLNVTSNDEYWHLIDADVDEGEDVLVNRISLTESDIIKLLQQVPYDDVLRFLTERHSFLDEEENGIIFGEYSETSMLKLLAISTKMVQILRKGLMTFNCMRFRALTDYITNLIKKTVTSVSRFWQACKGSFKSKDDALVLRLQVEYDHFILRSVVTILSSQRFGVWKFVSAIPFYGVTESMMWHIVWVFYNNGRDEIDELGGLCPYFSDLYWKSKFNEPAMKYLFREKLPSLSPSEAQCLLRSLANMILSRDYTEIEFVNTIATEIFEISFLVPDGAEEIIPTSNKILSESTKKHPFIISALIRKIKEALPDNDAIICPFETVPFESWQPSDDIFEILGSWLSDYSFDHLMNRLARVIITRLNYGQSSENKVHLNPRDHRKIALLIYKAIISHVKIEDLDNHFKTPFTRFDLDFVLKRANGKTVSAFLEWSWRVLLLLKLHIRDYPDYNDLIIANSEPGFFYPTPNILIDCDMFLICKGYESKNPFALYITIVASETGHLVSSFEDGIEILVSLLNSRCYIPCLNALHGFISINHTNLHSLATNSRFMNSFLSILLLDTSEVVDCLIGLIQSQIRNEKDKREIIHFWIELLCESTNSVFLKYSSSWLGTSSRGLRQLVHIINELVAYVFHDDDLMTSLVEVFAGHLSAMECVKAPSNTILRLLPWSSGPKKCDWTTPFHYLREKEPDKIWLAYLLIKADSLRMEKIWESIVVEMGSNMDISSEVAIRSICERFCHSPIPIDLLPINAWAKLIIDTPLDHTLMPLHFYNFFSCFFANSTSGGSCGLRLVPNSLLQSLRSKIDLIIQDHVKLLTEKPSESTKVPQTSSELYVLNQKIKFYRASLLWLQDLHLHDAFIDIEHLPGQYQIDMLKNVMNNTEGFFRALVDEQTILNNCKFFSNLWISVKTMNCESQTQKFIDESKENIPELNDKPLPPPDEKIPNIMFYDIDLIDSLEHNPMSLLNYINFNIKVILEEKSLFDAKSQKLHSLSVHLVDLISNLYEHVKKELKIKASCDSDGGYTECGGPALLTIEFSEARQNPTNFKAIERNRIKFDHIVNEMLEMPSDKTVCAALFLHKTMPTLIRLGSKIEKEDPCEDLVRYFISQIDASTPIIFSPAKNILNLIIENLDFDKVHRRDSNSLYLLQTSLEKASLIEYLVSRLVPSRCSVQCFLAMYKLISSNLYHTPSSILFVLLSKFDVTSWLNNASDDDCTQFINLLIGALLSLGKNPEKDEMIILGIYRRHLQHMVICRFPKFLVPILDHMLKGMDKFSIFPQLWDDILLSFGFYSRNQKTQMAEIVQEMKKYAESQPIFSSTELSNMILLFSQHFGELKAEKVKLDLLDHFKDYIWPISTVLSTISFMWIYINCKERNNFDNTSKMFYLVWKPFLISSSLNQSVEKVLFDRVWDFFIFNLTYFINTWQENCTNILSQSWNILAEYYLLAKSSVVSYSEALQSKLIKLPWSSYKPTREDIKLMFDAAQHEHCPPVILVSHIIRQVDWRNSIKYLPQSNLSETLEWLSSTIIYLADKPDSFHLESLPIFMIKSDEAKKICRLLRTRTKLSSLIRKKFDINQMYFKMIRIICEVGPDICPEKQSEDTLRKHLIYMDFIYGLILDAIRSDKSILKEEGEKVTGLLRSCINDIRPSLQQDKNNVTVMFSAFLSFVDSATISDPDHKLLDVIFELVTGSKDLIIEVLNCSQSSVKFLPLFITISEKCINSYAEAEGNLADMMHHYSVPNKFHPSIFKICHQSQAYLTLFVIYQMEKDTQNITDLLSDMIEWSRHLKPEPTNEAKVLATWYTLTKELFGNISSEESHNKLLATSIKLTKHQLSFVDEVTTHGFLSFMKLGRKPVSSRTAFSTAASAAFLLKRLIEELPSFHPLYSDIPTLLKFAIAKIQLIKKDKGFAENSLLVEKCLELVESENKIDSEGIKLLKSWLLAFYSEDPAFRFIVSDR